VGKSLKDGESMGHDWESSSRTYCPIRGEPTKRPNEHKEDNGRKDKKNQKKNLSFWDVLTDKLRKLEARLTDNDEPTYA